MSRKAFRILLYCAALLFTLYFSVVVVPPLIRNPDILGAFAAGFVNPYASGYSTDVIVCWFVLCMWVIYEASALSI